MAKLRDKEKWREWESFRENLRRATPVPKESEAEKQARIRRLEADRFEWFRYYFPNYCSHPFALFQKRSVNAVIDADTIYAVDAWAREHAKTAMSMMEKIYCLLTARIYNILFVSWSFDNAVELLTPMIINLESNERIINDYGLQKGFGTWDYSSGKWVLTGKQSIRAIGMGQSPRGTRNEEKRPDWLEFDDADSDEVCRNEMRLNKAWNWIEQAAIPAMSIDHAKKILFKGNIIAKDSIIIRALKKADFSQVVNILDSKGNPSWKERFTMEDINWMLSKISYASGQKEYFNNPITEGSVFKDVTFKDLPPLKDYQMLVCYTDPSFKSSKKNDYKATWLVGKYKDEFHIIKGFLEQTTTAEMVRWHYAVMDHVGDRACYYFMESNFLQDVLFEEFQKQSLASKRTVPLKGDDRKKPDKFARIESLLEPLNSNGKLFFNKAEENNPHMQRLIEQFKALEPGMTTHDDGPDAIEGAVYIINAKIRSMTPPLVVKYKPSKNRY